MLYEIISAQWNYTVLYLDLWSESQKISIQLRFVDNYKGIDAHSDFNKFVKDCLHCKLPVDAADLVRRFELPPEGGDDYGI